MSATRAQVEAVFAVVDRLIAAGDLDGARILTGAFGAVQQPSETIPVGDDSKRVAARDRKRRSREKRDMSRLSQTMSHVTESVTSGVARVSESQKTLLSGVVSAESESSERVVSSDARVTVTQNVTPVTTHVTRDNVTVTAEPPHALWRQIFEQWVFIAHHGKSIGKPHLFSQNFGDVARMAEQRCPDDPVGYAKEVIVRYVADRRKRGRDLSPRYFAADFGTFADSGQDVVGKPVEDPLVREMHEYESKWKDAQKRGDATAEATYAQKLRLLGQRMLSRAS